METNKQRDNLPLLPPNVANEKITIDRKVRALFSVNLYIKNLKNKHV